MQLRVLYPLTATSKGTTGHYRGWTNVNRVKLEDNSYAVCKNVQGSGGTYNTPAPVTVTFPIDIDDKVKVTRITVMYKDYRGEVNGKWSKFKSPTVTLDGTGLSKIGSGEAKTTAQMWNADFTNLSLKGSQINNNSKFSITLQYPKNSNSNTGDLYLDCIYIYLYYEDPVYVLSNGQNQDGTYLNPVKETVEGDIVENTIYFRNRDGIPDYNQLIELETTDGLELLSASCSVGSFNMDDFTWTVNPPVDCDYPDNVVSLKCRYLCTLTGEHQATATHRTAGTVHFKVHTVEYVPPSDGKFVTGDERTVMQFDYCESTKDFPVKLLISNPRGFDSKTCSYEFESSLDTITSGGTLKNISLDTENSINVDSVNFTSGHFNFHLTNKNGGFIAIVDLTFSFPWKSSYSGKGELQEFYITDDKGTLYSFTFKYYDTIGFRVDMTPCYMTISKVPMLTEAEGGGYVIIGKSNPNRNYLEIYEDTLSGFIEQHYRHIGGLVLPRSHYEPKYTFNNTLTESAYKNRKYLGKKGDWSETLSLNLTLPKFLWTSLKGFAQMDKPFWLNTAPDCSSEDLLNHRGWGVISKIDSLERINSWEYRGSLTVDYLTHDYNPFMRIELGNRVCDIDVPHDNLHVLDFGTDISGFYSINGNGLFNYTYSSGRSSPNNIYCETGQSLEFTNKWTVTNYGEYAFKWNSYLPRESNEFKNNTIEFELLDNTNGNVLLRYLLYDFEYYDEYDSPKNTCKASCVKYEESGSYSLFNDVIDLDYEGTLGYGSTVEFKFDNGNLILSDYGNKHYNAMIRNISLPATEYRIRVRFKNNDVGIVEPEFTCTLDISAYENNGGSVYSNYYNGLMVSPCMLPNHELVFYRVTEKGILYYYTGEDSNTRYIADPFDQYKGGVNLESENGVSVVTTDSGVNPLYLNNGLVKLGFDKLFGVVRIYLYDKKAQVWNYVQTLSLTYYEDFSIISISDDFISLQFGNTVWSMWRGRPFIQVEHGEDDLQIIDEYQYIQCEELIDSDGTIHHSGAFEEIYLNRKRTNTYLSITPTKIKVGDSITATACVWDSGDFQLAYDETYTPYGSINFMDADTLLESREYPNATWTILNREIQNNETVNILTNYVYDAVEDKQLIDGIIIDTDKTVNGNWNVFDCSHIAHLFNVQKGAKLTLRNCILINGRDEPLSGVSYGETSGNITLQNCILESSNGEVIEDYNGEIIVDTATENSALLKCYNKGE